MNRQIKRAFLDTAEGQIHYRTCGVGEPLLLLHQNQQSSNEYLEMMPLLAAKYQVIAIDFLGFGESDKPPRLYTVEDYVQTVLLLLDALHIDRASILGNHTGAFVAGELAAAHPQRVKQLILSNPVVFGEAGQAMLLQRFNQGFQIKPDGSHLIERWQARIQYVDSLELNHRLVIDDLKCFGYPLYAVWAVANYCLTLENRFSLIKCPTLILWGTVDMQQFERLGLAKAENRYLAAQAIPQAKIIDIAGGTICMMNQLYEQIAQVAIEFLDDDSNH